MKKFQFTLERMKSYKDEILDREKNTLLRLRREVNRIDERIDWLRGQFDAVNAEMKRKTLEGISVPELKGYRFQIENIHTQIQEMKRERERIEARVELQMKIVVTASQEVAGLDKLRERQMEEYNTAARKAEEETIAEFVSMKFVREGSVFVR